MSVEIWLKQMQVLIICRLKVSIDMFNNLIEHDILIIKYHVILILKYYQQNVPRVSDWKYSFCSKIACIIIQYKILSSFVVS